jgi:hypothetical protein
VQDIVQTFPRCYNWSAFPKKSAIGSVSNDLILSFRSKPIASLVSRNYETILKYLL